MYDTLIMLKPSASFSVDEMLEVVQGVAATGDGSVERIGSTIRRVTSAGHIEIVPNSSGYVIEESNEIAERFDIPCHGCATRYEMSGEDADMELFNDYLIINERLQELGRFVIFDSQECKLMFDDGAG
ncbi:MAG: hypothetical protein R3B84_16650 [Zavarzinella sp.]